MIWSTWPQKICRRQNLKIKWQQNKFSFKSAKHLTDVRVKIKAFTVPHKTTTWSTPQQNHLLLKQLTMPISAHSNSRKHAIKLIITFPCPKSPSNWCYLGWPFISNTVISSSSSSWSNGVISRVSSPRVDITPYLRDLLFLRRNLQVRHTWDLDN